MSGEPSAGEGMMSAEPEDITGTYRGAAGVQALTLDPTRHGLAFLAGLLLHDVGKILAETHPHLALLSVRFGWAGRDVFVECAVRPTDSPTAGRPCRPNRE